MMKEQLIDIYPNYGKDWKLHKVFRDENGIKKRTPINNWFDYFYISEDKLKEVMKYDELRDQIIQTVEVTNKKPLFYESRIFKIYVKGIWSKFKFMKYFRNDLDGMFELDVSSEMRYTIDNIKRFESTNYKILYFDIETSTDEGFPDYQNAIENITSISLYDNFKREYKLFCLKPNTWEKWKYLESEKFHQNCKVIFFDDEKEMLREFINFVNDRDYDILTAWNISFDLSYIFGRCDRLKVNKNDISPYNKVELRTRTNKQNREELFVNIEGRFVIDLLQQYKSVTFKEIPSYSLEYVSELELGKNKKKKKVLDFSKEWREHLDDLLLYSIKDVELLVELDTKLHLINYLEQLRIINYMPNIHYASIAKHLIDMALFREFGDRYIFPSRSNLEKVHLGGGYVKEPKLGIYDWVAIYDFSGLYPSLIRTFNLSKDMIISEAEADFIIHEDDLDTLSDRAKENLNREGFKTGWSLDNKGMIPTILEKMIDIRKDLKNKMKTLDTNSIEYRDLDIRQYALKAPTNAMYGVNAYNGFRLYEPRVAATITYLGRKLNKYCQKRIEEDFNFKVIGADTDSFFVHIGERNIEIMEQISKKINEVYVIDFVNEISNGRVKENFIKIEFETIYEKIMMLKKRRYLGILDNGKWIYKGVDLKRSNTPESIKICLQYYVEEMFKGRKERDIILETRDKLYFMRDKLEMFQLPMKISKEYETNLPQKRAADWANEYLKTNFKQGSKFFSLWVKGVYDIVGFMDIEQLKDKKIELDIDKYESILRDKINNLREENIFDYEWINREQKTLF